MKKHLTPGVSICALVVFSLAAGLLSTAQLTPSRITQKIDNASRTTIGGSTHPATKTAKDLGAVDRNRPLERMLLVLKPSSNQLSALNSLLDSQQDKTSPNYHKWLAPEQFAQQFGPSDEDVQKITGWLQQQGLSVAKVARGKQWIEFSGTALQVENAFQTSMHSYSRDGESHIANAKDISLPQALTPVVSGVLSLHNFLKKPMHSKVTQMKRDVDGKLKRINPDLTIYDPNSGNVYYFVAPGDFQTIYNARPLLSSGIDGSGASIAIVGRSDIWFSDVQAFRHIFGLPENDPNIILSGPAAGLTGDVVESSLDIEWSGAVAPQATINYVEAASTDTTDGVDLAATYIVDNVVSPIMSTSYGLCEALLGPAGNQFYNSLWEQAAAEGITAFVSSGDAGAAQCDADLQDAGLEPPGPALNGYTVNGLASTPYNVAVGGTQFNEDNWYAKYWNANNGTDNSSAFGYIPEQAWNESCDPTLPQVGTNCVYGQQNYNLEGGGGGPSSCSNSTVDANGNVTCISGYAKPSWQTGRGVPKDGVRDLPDVSLNASPDDDGYAFCVGGGCDYTEQSGVITVNQVDVVGGTSVSAPAMAGIMALVEQKNGAFQGQANYVLYKLAAQEKLNPCNSSKLTDPTKPNSCIFNDVTAGNNSTPGLPGYGTQSAQWAAGTGYYLSTGLGSVNAANLVAAWKNVTFQASTTTLTTSASTLKHGHALSISVTVQGSGGKEPTGDFSLLTDKYGAVGQFTLNKGAYAGSVSNLPGGVYNLTAHYAGDATLGGSTSSPVAVKVSTESSATTLALETVDQNGNLVPLSGPVQYDTTVYFNVSVAGLSGIGAPSGAVEVLDGTTVLATYTLNTQGVALFPSGIGYGFSLSVGTHNLSVKYVGDNSFKASVSAVTQVTITKQQAGTYTFASNNQAAVGEEVILSTTIFFGGINPTGTVQFYDNGKPIGPQLPIAYNGPTGENYPQALLVRKFSAGQHNITSSYSGDGNYLPVNANSQNAYSRAQITITPAVGAKTRVTIVQTPASVILGQSVSYYVEVKPLTKGGPVPTGNVWLMSAYYGGGSGTLQDGKTTLTYIGPNAGTFDFYAQYNGDSNYGVSASPVIQTIVERIAPTVTLTASATEVVAGTQTSLDFCVAGVEIIGNTGIVSGSSVQFYDALNGGSPQPLGGPLQLVPVNYPTLGYSLRLALPVGTNVITAYLPGDQNFLPATTAPVKVVVKR